MKKYANELKIKKVWKQVINQKKYGNKLKMDQLWTKGYYRTKISSKAFSIPILTAYEHRDSSAHEQSVIIEQKISFAYE